MSNEKPTEVIPTTQLTAKDFSSDQDVKWCPGCGDYSILAQMQRISPTLGVKKEDLGFRYRMLFQISLLYGYIWNSRNSR
jgi:hypothetical protein